MTLAVTRDRSGQPPTKLLKTPFFKHDGSEVEIAAAGNVRMGDNPIGTRTNDAR